LHPRPALSSPPASPTRRSSDLGLRASGRLSGVLGLGWDEKPQNPPGQALVLHASAVVGAILQNARLVERLERTLASERQLTDEQDRKSTRLNSSHVAISYAVFC